MLGSMCGYRYLSAAIGPLRGAKIGCPQKCTRNWVLSSVLVAALVCFGVVWCSAVWCGVVHCGVWSCVVWCTVEQCSAV